MAEPKTKLKGLEVSEVSVVDAGADPQADILITKKDGETKEPFYKRFFQKFCDVMGFDSQDVRKAVEAEDFSEKFIQHRMDKVRDEVWNACYALQDSIVSILMDGELEDREAKIGESVAQFDAFMKDAAEKWCCGKAVSGVEEPEPPDAYAVKKMQGLIAKADVKAKGGADTGNDPDTGKEPPDGGKGNSEGKDKDPKEDDDMGLDVAEMTPAEKLVYEDLKKRYSVEDDPGTPGGSDAGTGKAPAAGTEDAVTKAMQEAMEGVAKSMAEKMEAVFAPVMKKAEEAQEAQLLEVAKKYEVLGTKAEQLVPVLKSMKEASEETYNGFIATMDANVEAVEKSGLFSEIGKSGHFDGAAALTSDQAWETIEKKASAMMEKEPALTHAQAVDRVCQANPALVHAYEKQ